MSLGVFNPDELHEDFDLEAKRAGGRDGRGALPQDVFETYSAFANTDGGIILLGVTEREDETLQVHGIENPDRVINDLWAQLNNPQKVSRNILSNTAIQSLPTANNRWVIRIHVPRASRKERPVFINGNPLSGTFKRQHSGDFRCPENEVRRMLAEQVEDARDARLLEGFDHTDIDESTLKAYRNRFSAAKPDHPFSSADDMEFLRQLGGWMRDRQTGAQGLTMAGLLMFGKQASIQEAMPNYFVDYRELPPDGSRNSWVDRLTPDGSWSGNLFDFYRFTILRLFRDLKIPFKLNKDQREDETPIHMALREALVNAIIHADYSGSLSILVLKGPDYYEFRNPGRMRIPVNDALSGGNSDCRNRNMQKMFALLGLGEQAGSGIPRVLENWRSQHYRPPELSENRELDTTVLRLRTVSLLPEDALRRLRLRFGPGFDHLDEQNRMTLATAEIEGYVSNSRLKQITKLHPRDITLLLKGLVDSGMLEADGKGRGTTYRISGVEAVDLAVSSEDSASRSEDTMPRSEDSAWRSEDTMPRSEDSASAIAGHRGPMLDNPEQDVRLLEIAKPVRNARRVSGDILRSSILNLCAGHFLTLAQIANLLRRSSIDIRQRFIKPLVDEGLLERRFPQQPNHEQQAYRSTEKQ
jgi:ATP-dependent DNA helicase RecG